MRKAKLRHLNIREKHHSPINQAASHPHIIHGPIIIISRIDTYRGYPNNTNESRLKNCLNDPLPEDPSIKQLTVKAKFEKLRVTLKLLKADLAVKYRVGYNGEGGEDDVIDLIGPEVIQHLP